MRVSTCRLDVRSDLRRGYILHITNLEDRPFDYLVTFVLTVPLGLMGPTAPAPQDLDRFVTFTGSAGYSVEQTFRRVVVAEHAFLETGVAYSMKVRVFIGGQQTKSIGIEPAVSVGLAGLAEALRGPKFSPLNRLEGYVTLRLPTKRGTRGQLFQEPQAAAPVRVLVNPETRTLYRTGGQRLDMWEDPPPMSAGILGPPIDLPPVQNGFAYVPAATIERTEPLHVATGKAENELQPESVRSLTIQSLKYALDAINSDSADAGDYQGAGPVADEDRAGALVELLMEMGDDAELAAAVNRVLEDQRAPIRIRQP